MNRRITYLWAMVALIAVSGLAAPAPAAPATAAYFTTSPVMFSTPGSVTTLLPLSDGRMLAAGSFASIGGQAAPRSLAVLKSDGTLDLGFQADPRLQVEEITAAALQADGRIIIGGWFAQAPVPGSHLLRLSAAGAVDTTFQPFIAGNIYAILIDGDKIVIGGNFGAPTPRIARLNPNGTADSTFNGVGSGPDGAVHAIARQSSGTYVIAGDFASVNGQSQPGLARLHANGALDAAFAPGGFRASRRIAVLNDDSVVVGGEHICGDELFAWYTAAGAIKPALSPNPDLLQSITALLALPDGGFLIGGWASAVCINGSPTRHEAQVWRYAAGGAYQTLAAVGIHESDVLALALRSDGRLVAGGRVRHRTTQESLFAGLALFDLANNGIAQVAGFRPLVGDEAEITSLSRYADGRLLVAGDFSHANGAPRHGLARLLADGTLDPAFHPFAALPGGWSTAALALPDGRALADASSNQLFLIGADGSRTDLSAINDYGSVQALALQSDGKVLVGNRGSPHVRRLKADFSGNDPAFTAGIANDAVYALAVRDSMIFVAGNFSVYNGAARSGLARLDSSGAIDSGFVPPAFLTDVASQGQLYALAPLAGGGVLAGGYFQTVGGAAQPPLVRLSGGGALDSGFAAPAAGLHSVRSIAIQGDGSIWIGGIESSARRGPLVLHLGQNGALDPAFQSAVQSAHTVDSRVNVVLADAAGPGWVGGAFSQIDSSPAYGLARYVPLRGRVFAPQLKR